MSIDMKTLPNGIRIVSEYIPHVRSAAIGIWVGNGSRYEPEKVGGISHFIEHMIFKGTDRRSAQQIAMEVDALGGQVNAFTSKECTCYYLKTLDNHLDKGIDILADMFLHSKFADKEIELERGVVLEEIDMYEDTPEDVAVEKLFESCFSDSPLGRPILGTAETLAGMDSRVLHEYFDTFYKPADTVIALAGSFEEKTIEYIAELFGGMEGTGNNTFEQAHYHKSMVIRPKEIEQNHICMTFPGRSMHADNRYAMQMLSAILGDGMSSRLFQTVREQNGLCYSVYSFHTAHIDTGVFGVYTALGRETEKRAMALIGEVLHNFCEKGPALDELDRCREQRKAGMMMGMESTSARMNHLGRSVLFRGAVLSPEELMAGYDAVTTEQVHALAQEIFDFGNMSFAAVGQTGSETYYEDMISRFS